jgi:hypothetical protein
VQASLSTSSGHVMLLGSLMEYSLSIRLGIVQSSEQANVIRRCINKEAVLYINVIS